MGCEDEQYPQLCNGNRKCRVDLYLISTAAKWDIFLLGGIFYCYIIGVVVELALININIIYKSCFMNLYINKVQR